MRNRCGLGVGLAVASALLIVASPGRACVGDCDASASVSVSEVVTCVGIALGARSLAACGACDADGSGDVTIGELIAAVAAVLQGCGTPSPTATATVICGDGHVDRGVGEQCDDANNVGGDGCAANCTAEHRRTANFDPSLTHAVTQTASFPVALDHLTGSQVLTVGEARDGEVIGGAAT